MKFFNKKYFFAPVLILVVMAIPAGAAVTVNAGPTSLVTSPTLVKAASGQIGLFEITLSQDDGEILASVSVMVNPNATTTVSSVDLASVSVYKDDGNGSFSSVFDLLAGSNATVGISTTTVIATGANNTLTGGKFFVTLATSASWNGSMPADSITVTLPANGITTSANSPATSAVTTASLTADTGGPSLVSAVAKNTGGTGSKEPGDGVDLTFSESTNKPVINSGNVNTVLPLSGGHSWLSSDGTLGGASWNVAGTMLTLTLGATTTASSTLASVAVGDTASLAGATIADLAGNPASGAKIISGNFGGKPADNDEEEDKPTRGKCGNGLVNGRLYKVRGADTVYLSAACRLKPFRGAAVFHAKGYKFQNIIELSSLEGANASSTDTVLPSEGTLLKGKGPTVFLIVLENSKKLKRAFRSAGKFLGLGFNFSQITEISDEDLAQIQAGDPVSENENHPSGTLIKCQNSALVFQVMDKGKFPFRSAEAFLARGHSWQHIATVDCGRLPYILGAPIDD